MNVGGAITINTAWPALAQLTAGDTIKLSAGTHTLSGNIAAGTAGTAVAPLYFEGVNATTGVGPVYGANRPVVAAGAYTFIFASYYSVENVVVTTAAAAGLSGGTYSSVKNCKSTQSGSGTTKVAITIDSYSSTLFCEATGTGTGISGGLYAFVYGCYVHDNVLGINVAGGGTAIVNTVIDTCATGISAASVDYLRLISSVIYNSTTLGVSATDSLGDVFLNNIISQCAVGASWTTANQLINTWEGNLWNNTDDIQGTSVTMGASDLTLAVGTQCMNAPATGDFTLTYAPALTAAVQITTNQGVSVAGFHWNIGVDQTDAAASGGATIGPWEQPFK